MIVESKRGRRIVRERSNSYEGKVGQRNALSEITTRRPIVVSCAVISLGFGFAMQSQGSGPHDIWS